MVDDTLLVPCRIGKRWLRHILTRTKTLHRSLSQDFPHWRNRWASSGCSGSTPEHNQQVAARVDATLLPTSSVGPAGWGAQGPCADAACLTP
eukprot:jgi/Tetstr1/429174/TSEL_019127.t1